MRYINLLFTFLLTYLLVILQKLEGQYAAKFIVLRFLIIDLCLYSSFPVFVNPSQNRKTLFTFGEFIYC